MAHDLDPEVQINLYLKLQCELCQEKPHPVEQGQVSDDMTEKSFLALVFLHLM